MRFVLAVLGMIAVLSVAHANDPENSVDKELREYRGTGKFHVMQAALATIQNFGLVVTSLDHNAGLISTTGYALYPEPPFSIELKVEQKKNNVTVSAVAAVDGHSEPEGSKMYSSFYHELDKHVRQIRTARK